MYIQSDAQPLQNDNNNSNQRGPTANSVFCKASIFDIFSFIPVPKAHPVSTKRSVIGSLILILIFLSYISYSLYSFFYNNTPRVNQTIRSLDPNYIGQVPDIAFAFVNSENFTTSFYDPTYWTFTFQQVTVYQNASIPRNYTTLPISPCNPTWLNMSFPVICPNQSAYIQGVLYSTPVNQYARLKVSMCINSTANNNSCASNDTIASAMMTGRIFIFLRNYPALDLVTGAEENPIPFESYFYFMVWSLYNRAEMLVQLNSINRHPNLLTTFTAQTTESLQIQQQNTYISQVPQNVTHDMFLWWIRLDEDQMVTDVVYQTTGDMLGTWGGLWGVLFSVGAFYFLRYNTKTFYTNKPDWENFDEEFHEVGQVAKRTLSLLNRSKSIPLNTATTNNNAPIAQGNTNGDYAGNNLENNGQRRQSAMNIEVLDKSGNTQSLLEKK